MEHKMMIKINPKKNSVFTRESCCLCGQDFDADDIIMELSRLYYPLDEYEFFGYVCPDCARSDVLEIRDRIKDRCHELEMMKKELSDMANNSDWFIVIPEALHESDRLHRSEA